MDYLVIQHADDTLVVMIACELQLVVMKGILDDYAASTSLYINFSKLMLVPIN
jgi:hypothetical protein